MRESLLDVTNLSFNYGGKKALHQVSFSLTRGEHFIIIGKNGSGKSTLLRCLAGLLQGEGEILFDGRGLGSWPREQFAAKVGYVPQKLYFSFPFTVQKFVEISYYPLFGWGISAKEQESIACAALERMRALHLAKRLVTELSGGEQQRVILAAALVCNPLLMICDEPFASLDPCGQEQLANLFLELRGSGVTIVTATHDINFALQLADRVLALSSGGIAFEGGGKELANATVLAEIYGRPFELLEHPSSGRGVVCPTAYLERA